MSNQYSRFARDPKGGTVLDDIVTTESMIRSTDFQQKLAAARVMREKVMAQREREAALTHRMNTDMAGAADTVPTFMRATPLQPSAEVTMPALKGPVLDTAPRRPARGPSFQLLAEVEPSVVSDAPSVMQRAKDIAEAATRAGRVASTGAAHWIKGKTAQAAAAAPSLAQSKAVAEDALARVGGVAATCRQNSASAATTILSRVRGGFGGAAAAIAGPVAALQQRLGQTTGQQRPYLAMAAGTACLLALGLVLWSFGGSHPSTALAQHQAKAALLETPDAQDPSVAFVVSTLATPGVVAVAKDRPTPKLAAYAFASVEANALALPDLALTPQPIGPVAVGSASATSAWVPAQQFEAQVAAALSLVSRSGFQPGSLPNSTIVGSDTPRLAPETTATPVAAPAKLPSTKYAVKRSLRPLPRVLAGQ